MKESALKKDSFYFSDRGPGTEHKLFSFFFLLLMCEALCLVGSFLFRTASSETVLTMPDKTGIFLHRTPFIHKI